ncbi:hypothetical protein [Streptomyces agglomeratus]|uniref:hypothetical protein n=1 Tax=Streptomyces agglomeratus TaxID=285458 RepID=UPI0008543F7D|nr:hypothetical protein [Streptomyces agglomeratus]OEJ49519.1 hypothetical protein BGK72_00480 [Streptomyces agglomeratus]
MLAEQLRSDACVDVVDAEQQVMGRMRVTGWGSGTSIVDMSRSPVTVNWWHVCAALQGKEHFKESPAEMAMLEIAGRRRRGS